MFKKDVFENMVPEIRVYMNRYVREVLHEDEIPVQKKAEEIYKGMYAETEKIGGRQNPLASNLYEYMTFCAYYEATEHRIGVDSVPIISGWMLEKKKWMGKIVDFNKKSSVRLIDKVFSITANMTARKVSKGEWGNTWRIEHNPKGYTQGVSYVLSNCPLCSFSKAHGYEDLLPYFCRIDHDSALLMHGRLIRFETEARGGKCCDYWFVGDKSEIAKKYENLLKK